MANAYYDHREHILRGLLKKHGVRDEEVEAALDPNAADRRTAWFMYDCHVFAKVWDGSEAKGLFDRELIAARLRELFNQDGCGSVFVRPWPDGPASVDTAKTMTQTERNQQIDQQRQREFYDEDLALERMRQEIQHGRQDQPAAEPECN